MAQPKALTRKEILSAVPWRNPAVEEVRGEKGQLRLSLPRGGSKVERLLSWFIALPRRKVFELEEHGRWVWEQCDGKRSLDSIAREGARQWDVGLETARQAVFKYSGTLVRRGLLIMQVRNEGRRS